MYLQFSWPLNAPQEYSKYLRDYFPIIISTYLLPTCGQESLKTINFSPFSFEVKTYHDNLFISTGRIMKGRVAIMVKMIHRSSMAE